MQLQQTLRNPVTCTGTEFYGGNQVRIDIAPADENTGILFQTKRGDVKATLQNARQSRSAILLQQGRARVLHVEHFLATLFAYGIDNATVKLTRIPTRSFSALERLGLATGVEIVPVSHNREIALCEKIEEMGVTQQSEERHLWTIGGVIETAKLNFYPRINGLVMRAKTDYPGIGEQTIEFEITPQMYKDHLAGSRMYVKHAPSWAPKWLAGSIASLMNPTFGIGHGFTENTIFLPTKDPNVWRARERYKAEIARHTIVDRLGAIALFGARLEGALVESYRSGHRNDIETLRQLERERTLPRTYV